MPTIYIVAGNNAQTLNAMTAINNALTSALSGIQEGLKSVAERADRISTFAANPDSDSLTSDLIGIKQDLYQIGANQKVIKTLQKLDKSILDILA